MSFWSAPANPWIWYPAFVALIAVLARLEWRKRRTVRTAALNGAMFGTNLVLLDHNVGLASRICLSIGAGMIAALMVWAWERQRRGAPSA